ncbi:hypothetical protein COU77_04025 [Candidatus Peregrinibacteria bacterium CG10_big_fil_rev_8_21_14_0_10_49_16]|nr:MAG: hypothetical protein COU77_04025 [Candidatus Peregrinibacteria bacterium CG10_big_fil_rev_8_21_14_0_10_49_16]
MHKPFKLHKNIEHPRKFFPEYEKKMAYRTQERIQKLLKWSQGKVNDLLGQLFYVMVRCFDTRSHESMHRKVM